MFLCFFLDFTYRLLKGLPIACPGGQDRDFLALGAVSPSLWQPTFRRARQYCGQVDRAQCLSVS